MVGNGFRVHTFFPGNIFGEQRMSPFYLLDYNAKYYFPPSETPRGVGVHPHRGFETVTVAYKGRIAHHDSAGNSGIIGEGDVQWMTAGSGVLHKEYHEKSFSRTGGVFQMAQLWVNLPAKFKMAQPKYQPLMHKNMGKYFLPDGKGTVNVISGNFKNIKGPASTFTPIHLFDIRMNTGAKLNLTLPSDFNTGLLIIDGKLDVNGQEAKEDEFVLFKNNGTDFHLEAAMESIVLLMSGKPIDEPIAQFGPFLMNHRRELEKAVDDFNNGKFGYLED
ncbi:MAG: pirin family protein [Chlorobi bacterium]|nr:pirin family protein [Chlorobiota bacterium]